MLKSAMEKRKAEVGEYCNSIQTVIFPLKTQYMQATFLIKNYLNNVLYTTLLI